MERRSGVERRHGWVSGECPIDPEGYYTAMQQVKNNAAQIALLEAQMKQFIEARLIAEGAVKGSKATLAAAAVLVVTSVAMVISIFIAVASGKISLMDVIKALF